MKYRITENITDGFLPDGSGKPFILFKTDEIVEGEIKYYVINGLHEEGLYAYSNHLNIGKFEDYKRKGLVFIPKNKLEQDEFFLGVRWSLLFNLYGAYIIAAILVVVALLVVYVKRKKVS